MDLQLKDHVIVVTGGAKGIGAAIVRTCAQEGAIPVIVNRAGEAGERLQSELLASGKKTMLIAADLIESAACEAAVCRTIEAFGHIDGLVNNAGVNDRVGLESGSPEEYLASLRRNLLHYYNFAHFALPYLKQTRGAIVNIASKTAVTGQGGTSGYASSKGAQLALSPR